MDLPKLRVASLSLTILIAFMSCSVWQRFELWAHPQDESDINLLMQLAQPNGINLVEDDALERLHADEEILSLKSKGSRFEYFIYVTRPTMDDYPGILELTRFKPPAFLEKKPVGYMIYDFPLFEEKLTGREYYFNSNYELCNAMLFSNHPIDSARFLLVVFNVSSSSTILREPGLLCLYAHAESDLYKTIRNF